MSVVSISRTFSDPRLKAGESVLLRSKILPASPSAQMGQLIGRQLHANVQKFTGQRLGSEPRVCGTIPVYFTRYAAIDPTHALLRKHATLQHLSCTLPFSVH